MTKALLTLMDNKNYKRLDIYGKSLKDQSDEEKSLYVGLFSPNPNSHDTVYGNNLEEILHRLYEHGYSLKRIEIKKDLTKNEISKKVNLKELIEKIKQQSPPI